MKKLMILLILTFTISACSGNTEPKEDLSLYETIIDRNELIVAVSPDYVPYEFIDPNKEGQDQYVGADIDLAKKVAADLGVELTIKAMDFSDIPSAIARHRFDIGISGFTYSEERAEQIQFSNPYDNSESTCQGLLVRKDKLDDYKSLADFEDAKIAVQNGSLQQIYLDEELPNANVNLVKKLDDAILELNYDKVDAVAISCESGTSFTKNNKEIALSDVTFDIIDEEGMMVIMPKDETDLLDKINQSIEEVKEENLYDKWMIKANELADELGELDNE